MIKTIRNLGAATAVLAVAAFAPAAAQAHGHNGKGLHCGRGHAKHSHKLGRTCQSANTHRHHAGTTSSTTTTSANDTNGQGQQQSNPARTCRQEQSTDQAGFTQKYGSGKNAFGKCVSQQAQQQDQSGSDSDSGS